MVTLTIEELYEHHIASRPAEEQLRLIQLIAQQLAQDPRLQSEKKRSILELEGLGEEIWRGIDAQDYVNQLRDEWDKPLEKP